MLGQSKVTDSLLQSAVWVEEGIGYELTLTPDGTFQQDYGENVRRGRYLLGRYETDPDHRELTLSVDYFLGRNKLAERYREGRDYHLTYVIDSLTAEKLVLKDVLTRERRRFDGRPADQEDDPARRRLPVPDFGELKLPDKG